MTYLDENSNFQSKKDIGLVNEVFKNDKLINSKGIIGVRYSTSVTLNYLMKIVWMKYNLY